MTIAELGAIGEFVGSIAVLVTLAFLTLQFRQYRKSLNSSTTHQTFQQLNQLNARLADDPELAEIMERAYTDPSSLSEMEQRRYSWMQTCYYNVLGNLYEQYLEGTCRERLFLNHAYQLKWAIGTPGGKLWRERTSLHPELLAYLDELPEIEEGPVAFKLS